MEENLDEINLLDYVNVLRKHMRMLLLIVVLSVIVTGIVSVLLPKVYRASAVIIPVSETGARREGMSTIATQFGIPASSSTDASEIVSLLNSNILMEKVIKRYNLLPVLFKKKPAGKSANDKIWSGIRYLKNNVLRVNHKKTEGIIKLSAEFGNPSTASDILNDILTELTDYMSGEAKRVAETNRKYLESLIEKNSDPLIRQKIYSLIAQQIETSMLAEVKENFAFKVIDPPKTPDRKVRPRLVLNILLSFVVSLFAGIFIVFFREYWTNLKKSQEIER